ncbi:hypothetical protein ES705_50160 [subsurface metagenome]
MVFHEPEAMELLRGAGAKIDQQNRVRIPPHLVEEAIRSAPSAINIWKRESELSLELKDRKIYFGPGSDTPFTVDVHTHERRKPLKVDIENIARICDFLKNIDFVMCKVKECRTSRGSGNLMPFRVKS